MSANAPTPDVLAQLMGAKLPETPQEMRAMLEGFAGLMNADLGQVTISSKVDARYPLGFTIQGYTPDIGAYFEPSWSPSPVNFLTSDGTEQSVRWQFEVGGTVGFRYLAPMFCDLFRWMRLGVGYRFGEGIGGWHIRIGGDRLTRLPLP